MSSLKEYISIDQVECLNEDNTHNVKTLFSEDPESCLRSDCDPQLLLSIPFTSPVKLNGVRFTFRTGVDPACVPSEIRVFSNQVSLDFGDAEAAPPLQTLTKDDILSGNTVPLKFVLFQNVFSIQLFVVDNCGGDFSELGAIEFFGSPAENMNMSM